MWFSFEIAFNPVLVFLNQVTTIIFFINVLMEALTCHGYMNILTGLAPKGDLDRNIIVQPLLFFIGSFFPVSPKESLRCMYNLLEA